MRFTLPSALGRWCDVAIPFDLNLIGNIKSCNVCRIMNKGVYDEYQGQEYVKL